ncbi:MAG: hypothetical protein J5I65_17975 [Aridibacter famidurans]|nr:hypothetical protein [Aridibacter famidurans]
MEPYEFIIGHEKVTEAFGRWPSFHDAEILRVLLERGEHGKNDASSTSVELVLRAWTIKNDLTGTGPYDQDNESIVHFRFEGISDLEIGGLNNQNVISGLSFELLDGSENGAPVVRVDIGPCYGLAGEFRAKKAEIVNVTPVESIG